MNFSFFRSMSVVLTLALTTGCASITRGTDDKLEITTEPPGATVELTRTKGKFTDKQLIKAIGEEQALELLDGEKTYEGPISKTTPTTFVVPRKGEYTLVISKQGYQSQEVLVGNKVVGAGATGMAGNIILGGVIGLGVDAATGAAKDLTPNPVHLLLVEEGTETILEGEAEQVTELEETETELQGEVILTQEEPDTSEISTSTSQEE